MSYSHRIQAIQKKGLNRMRWTGIAAALVAAAVVTQGVTERHREFKAVSAWTREQATPTVELIHAKVGSSSNVLQLPGYLQAFYDAPIHARVDGYLLHWYHDIGDQVKAGELLATIDTPELDQELGKAKADLVTAKARLDLAKVTTKRWNNLLKDDAVSQEDADVKAADYQAQLAIVQAAEASVNRLQALEAFKRIVSPFDGVVTARKTDVGALISAGGDAGHELFSVADVHQLRLYVRVPQIYLSDVHKGLKATLKVPEYPGRVFLATFVNTSEAINDNSGTVLVEMLVENGKGTLKPGDYATVAMDLTVSHPSLQVPASALIFRNAGLEVATLGPQNRVVMKRIHIAQDHGNFVLVDEGVEATDAIIDKPLDSLAEGDQVLPVQSEQR